MSSFSNADTGDKPADPYKARNMEEPSVQEKIHDLGAFVDRSKFCMMTTKSTEGGTLASRCMAVAGKVNASASTTHSRGSSKLTANRKTTASTSSSTPTPNPARPTTSKTPPT